MDEKYLFSFEKKKSRFCLEILYYAEISTSLQAVIRNVGVFFLLIQLPLKCIIITFLSHLV